MASSDKDISVSISAQIADFKKGLDEASAATRGFASQVSGHFSSLAAPVEQFTKSLALIGSIAAGGYVFGSFISATVEAGSEVKKLSKSFGMTVEDASNLRTELKLAGVGVDEYSATAMKLERQLRTNETQLKSYGLATRDSSGHLLDQNTLMQGAIKWLGDYKAGTDRNIAAQTLFGRSVGEVSGFLKLNAELAERAKKTTADLGLGEDKESLQNIRAYKLAMQDLSLSFEGIKKAIGEAVLPYLTSFATWFRSQAPLIISSMKEIVKTVIDGSIDLAIAIVNMISSLKEMKNEAASAFHALAAVGLAATGQLVKAFQELGMSIKSATDVSGSAADLKDRIAALESLRNNLKHVGGAGASSTPSEDTGKGTKSATGLLTDKKGGELAKLKAENSKMVQEQDIKIAMQTSQFELDLGKKTNEQFLKDKLESQIKLDAIELDTANKKIAAAGGDVVNRQKAENEKLKIIQESALKEKEIDHQIVMERQKDLLQLASAINSSLVSGLAGVFDSIGKGVDGLKAALTSFLNSMKTALNQFAAQTVIKSLFGANSGPGGAGGLFTSLFAGFKAGGGPIGAGQWAIVGEKGPEAIAAGSSGATVFPNSALGGGDIHFNTSVDARGSSVGPDHVAMAVRQGMSEVMKKMPQMLSGFQNRYAT